MGVCGVENTAVVDLAQEDKEIDDIKEKRYRGEKLRKSHIGLTQFGIQSRYFESEKETLLIICWDKRFATRLFRENRDYDQPTYISYDSPREREREEI